MQDYHKVSILNEIMTVLQLVAILSRLFNKFDTYFESFYLKGSMSNLMDLVSLITSIYFVAHIMACMFYYIGYNSKASGDSWLFAEGLMDEEPLVRYNFAFYWATMTMVTVGYGDVTPKNQYEMVFVNVSMFISSIVFAYSGNSIGMILKNLADSQVTLK